MTSISSDEFVPFELDDKYLISGLIAEGGMGKVFAGETKLVHHRVAVKILHAELVKQPEMLLRFKIEAEIASSLNHPNIVNVCGSGVTADGKPYLAMDYVDGRSLEYMLHSKGKIDTGLCISIFAQLARAIEYSHEKGVIHRDVKPSNVMLQPDGESGYVVKLLDFGIAKSISVEDTVARELTLPGTVFGSVLYMSPEQILGKSVDFRSDIYSFGCLLFHALAGKPPYSASAPVDCMQMHVSESIPDVAEYLPDQACAEALAKIVSTCMRKDPVQRFENSQQLRAAIEKLSETIVSPPSSFTTSESSSSSSLPSALAPSFSRNDILGFVAILALAAMFSAVPFVYDLDLARAESKKNANNPNARKKDGSESSEEATALATKKVDALLEQVETAIKEKNFAEAEKLARTAYLTSLSLAPEDPKIAEALFMLGQVFEARQNYQGALQAYNWTLSFRQSKFGPMAPQTEIVRHRIGILQHLLKETKGLSVPPRIESK